MIITDVPAAVVTFGAQLLTIKAVVLFPGDKIEELLDSGLGCTIHNLDNDSQYQCVETHSEIKTPAPPEASFE